VFCNIGWIWLSVNLFNTLRSVAYITSVYIVLRYICFGISNFFDPSVTEETWVVKMRYWCIKIVPVLVLHFMAQYLFFRLFYSFHNFSDFQIFRPEYHWRDLISRNAHLVHQNWYRISFICKHFHVYTTFFFKYRHFFKKILFKIQVKPWCELIIFLLISYSEKIL
jgi:hypothetical protein